ncbi:MAG TPA: hypothetical protein VN577_23835 [Terriglobales bacterium]|nr:hypothetical protein [Terriglobales bacterium]
MFQTALETLQADPDRTLQSLHTHRHAIDTGMKEWLRDVPASQDERPISFPSTVELIRIVTLHHPEYLRRAEHIFGNVLHLFWGILKKKSVGGAFDLRSALAVLESKRQAILATGYRDDIRNGIAHGQVVFTGNGIHYGPMESKAELLASDLLHELDRLWMTCNSLVLASIVFVGEHLERLGTTFLPPSRLAVLFSEVAAEHPGFSVLDVVESDYPRTGRQLHLSVYSACRSRTALIADCSRVSLNLWRFGARDYQRFLFTIAHPGKQITSTLAIEPSKLASLTQENAPLERLSEALPDPSLLWYDESSLSLKIRSASILLRANLHLAREDASARLRAAGFLRTRTRYIIRSVEDRSAGRWIRLEVTAVLVDESDATNVRILREITRCIIRETRSRLHWSKPDGLSRTVPLIGRPKYVWVKLFRRDSTVREIGHGGWLGANLLVTAEKVFGFSGDPVFVPNAQEIWRGIHLRYGLDADAYSAAVRELQNLVDEIVRDPSD